MIGAEQFREILIEITFIDRDTIESAGICPDTAARMMSDPIMTFRTMTVGERKLFWPLVEASLGRTQWSERYREEWSWP
jgi:hypothetical protein